MFDFPTSPPVGTSVPLPDGSVRTWDGEKWIAGAGRAAGNTPEDIATPVIDNTGTLTLDLGKGGVFRVHFNRDITTLALANVVPSKVTTCQLELLGDGFQHALSFGAWTVATGTPVPTSAAGRKDLYDIRTDSAHVLVWLVAQNVPA